MSQAVRKPMTIVEFLDWEDRQDLRHEFDGTDIVAMTGGSASHAAIQRNVILALGNRLKRRRGQVFGSELKIEVAGRIRYPDCFIVCSPVPPKTKVVRDPVVIVEVLSEGTERIDLVKKNQEYASTPSVSRYVVLSQDEISGTMFERIGDDWVGRLLRADTVVAMPEIGIEVPMNEFYEGLDVAGSSTAAPLP